MGARIRRMVQEKDVLFGGLARGLIGVWVGGGGVAMNATTCSIYTMYASF